MDFGSAVDTFIGISCDTFCCVVDSEEIVMAEERIFVEKVEKDHFPLCVACWTDGEDYFCSWDGEDKPTNKEICEKKCPYDHTITRQEAIERMAKGIHFYEWGHHKNMPKWEELNFDIQQDYKNMAEAALNALLEGK